MSDGGHQIRPAAFRAGALLRVPQRDRESADRARVMMPPVAGLAGVPLVDAARAGLAVLAPVPHVADADQELGPVRQVQRPFWMPGPGAQALVGPRLRPPAAVLVVVEREHLLHVPAQRGPGADAGQPRGGLVENDDPAVAVGDHEAVGQVVGADQACGQVLGRPERAGRCREIPARGRGRMARHDPVHSNAASAWPAVWLHLSPGWARPPARGPGCPRAGAAAPFGRWPVTLTGLLMTQRDQTLARPACRAAPRVALSVHTVGGGTPLRADPAAAGPAASRPGQAVGARWARTEAYRQTAAAAA